MEAAAPAARLPESSRPMQRLFGYLRSYQGRLLWASGSSVLNKILDLMPPLLVGWVIDSLRGKPPVWIASLAGTRDPWSMAVVLAGLSVVIFFFESFFQWLYQAGFMRLDQLVQHAVLFIFAFAVIFPISWQLSLVAAAPIPAILWGSLYYQRRIQPRYRRVRESVGGLASRLENNLAGINVIKSFTAEAFETERVRQASAEYQRANFEAIRLSALYTPLIRMAIVVGFAGVLLIGSYWILNGSGIITVGELVLFAMMTERLLWPLTRLGTTVDDFERARASARRAFGLLDTEPAILDPEHPEPLGRALGEVTFDRVEFRYSRGRADQPVLRELSFRIAPGETLGIAGPTGAGKSTLIKLLLRLYDVSGGAVRLDGHDVRSVTLADLRRNIALVSQDVYLFHGTIRENIAYSSDAPLEEVVRATRLAQLHDFVISLPDGYDTLVGERGVKLSGGQRQRLSIARAIVKDAPILILDEATSSVDTETERAIQQSLARLTAGRTALIIAHRLSTIRHADRILVLRDGKVAEEGHHDDLLARGGTYADLWHIQSGELEEVVA